MRKHTTILVALVLLLGAAPASADDGDALTGVWLTEPKPDGNSRVEVVKEGDTYRGKIIWLEKPLYGPDEEKPGELKTDLNNPDPARQSDPVIGMPLVEGFHYAGKNLWKGGTIYDPDNGKTYKCKIWLKDDGSLKVRGFIGISLLGRNTVWTPVAPEDLEPAEAPAPVEPDVAPADE